MIHIKQPGYTSARGQGWNDSILAGAGTKSIWNFSQGQVLDEIFQRLYPKSTQVKQKNFKNSGPKSLKKLQTDWDWDLNLIPGTAIMALLQSGSPLKTYLHLWSVSIQSAAVCTVVCTVVCIVVCTVVCTVVW